MKRLLILRHAKAKTGDPGADWLRPLAKRGERDAEEVGRRLFRAHGRPEAIVSSDAVRARQTAVIVAEAAGIAEEAVDLDDRVYLADLEDLVPVVRGLPDAADIVLLVGHNPGLEELAAHLAGIDADEVVIPTAGLVRLDCDVDHWTQLRQGCAEFTGVEEP